MLVGLSVGCGGSSGDDSGETASGSSAGTTSTAEATSTSGVTTSATEGSTSTDGPTSTTATTQNSEECQTLLDQEAIWYVEITLRNEGTEPVFFVHAQDCSPKEPLAIAGPDGGGEFQWWSHPCDVTCHEAFYGLCECQAPCAADSVLMLAPGGSYTIGWEAAMYLPHAAPAACVADPTCTDCLLVRTAPKGIYELRSIGGSEATGCAEPGDCTCSPNEEGWCEIAASGIGGAAREASTSLDLPAMYEATLVFD
ncbi:MAG TPA: hypothetical protein VIK91_10615 [Nannocystis sp.]